MQQLEKLAAFAAQNRIMGNSFKRNSLLKPLDIILQELGRCPNPNDPNELGLVRAGTKGLIFEHLERVAKSEYKPGQTKQLKINQYVDLFFDELLGQAHQGKVTRLLGRDRLIRSAYLVYFREAWAQMQVARGKASDPAAALDQLDKLENAEAEPEQLSLDLA